MDKSQELFLTKTLKNKSKLRRLKVSKILQSMLTKVQKLKLITNQVKLLKSIPNIL